MKEMKYSASRRNWLRMMAALGAGAVSQFIPDGVRQAMAASKLVVGAIYVGAKDDFGYNQSQAEAAAALRKLPGVRVVEEERVPETIAVQKTMEAMVNEDGAGMVFATSFGYFSPYVLKVAQEYPSVDFSHCGGLWKPGMPKNAGSFFGYIDECVYLNGMAAAYASKSKKLGFVAAKPIPQVLRNINAFLLGARSVNPACTVSVIFTGDWSLPVKEAEASNSLVDQGVDVLTCHVDSPKVVIETAERRGIYCCGYHVNQAVLAPKGYLTGAEWNWETPYTILVNNAMAGKPMINFLRGGLKEGFVRTSPFGPAVSAKAKQHSLAVKARMMAGDFVIFKGPLLDNSGKTVIPAGVVQAQRDEVLESMNYLVDGVIGHV